LSANIPRALLWTKSTRQGIYGFTLTGLVSELDAFEGDEYTGNNGRYIEQTSIIRVLGNRAPRRRPAGKLVKNYVKENGRSIKKALKQLSRERLIGYKNNGRSIYLNPRYRLEIYDFIDNHLLED